MFSFKTFKMAKSIPDFDQLQKDVLDLKGEYNLKGIKFYKCKDFVERGYGTGALSTRHFYRNSKTTDKEYQV